MYFVLFQTLESQRRHQHPDQDHPGQPRGLQDHLQSEWRKYYRETQGELPGKLERGPPGKEADEVVPRAFELVRQVALLQPEEVVPAHGAETGHGARRD